MEKPNFVIERVPPKLSDCYFYHKMDLPEIGEVGGEWDLRGNENAYLGNQDFAGKTVLEVGTASGHLCFYMETQGAKVTAYDLSSNQPWDVVPHQNTDIENILQTRRKHMERINNSYWFAHDVLNSKATVAYGTVYDIDESLGTYDIVTLGSILLHLRDPFLALQNACSRSRDKIIITDIWSADDPGAFFYGNFVGDNHIKFLPNSRSTDQWDTWWYLPPNLLVEILKILGFPKVEISFHTQKFLRGDRSLFTLVAQRGAQGKVSEVDTQTFAKDGLKPEQVASFENDILSSFSTERLLEHLKSRES